MLYNINHLGEVFAAARVGSYVMTDTHLVRPDAVEKACSLWTAHAKEHDRVDILKMRLWDAPEPGRCVPTTLGIELFYAPDDMQAQARILLIHAEEECE